LLKEEVAIFAKYDSSGTLYWYKLITRQNDDGIFYTPVVKANDFIINTTGIYITGYLSKPTGSPYYYSIGNSMFYVDTAGAHLYGLANEFFLCKLNFNGAVVWNKTSHQADIYPSTGCSIATDKNNNIVLAAAKINHLCCGNYQSSFNLGSDPYF
jgi:hypothetical protein